MAVAFITTLPFNTIQIGLVVPGDRNGESILFFTQAFSALTRYLMSDVHYPVYSVVVKTAEIPQIPDHLIIRRDEPNTTPNTTPLYHCMVDMMAEAYREHLLIKYSSEKRRCHGDGTFTTLVRAHL